MCLRLYVFLFLFLFRIFISYNLGTFLVYSRIEINWPLKATCSIINHSRNDSHFYAVPVFCFVDQGRVWMSIPRKIRKKKKSGHRESNQWNVKALGPGTGIYNIRIPLSKVLSCDTCFAYVYNLIVGAPKTVRLTVIN